MKIVLAPDKYKSNMTSPEVCEVIADAFRSVIPDVQIVSLPMADGGDGTTRAMAAASGAELRTVEVTGPLGGKVLAEYAFHPQKKIGVMEMASASGIALVKAEELNPLRATTYGTGEVLKALLDDGAEQITIGIGGSATVDGGAGMAQALGYKLLDAEDNELATGAAELAKLARIDASGADPRLKNVRIDVACDVTSPLLGKTGAATVFGPQKGATPEMVVTLENNLARLAEIWMKQGMIDRVDAPGDGAAGGLGAGLRAFCFAKPRSGARLVMETLDFEKHIADADLVITGEGKTDNQTEAGKLCGEIAAAAHAKGVKVMLVSGCLDDNGGDINDFNTVFDYVFTTSSGRTEWQDIKAHGRSDLGFLCRNIAKIFRNGVK